MVSGEHARAAELTIALSLATDLGTGQPMDHGLRTTWLSLAVADALSLDDSTRSCVYHVALLRFLGCTSDASETAALAGGDDLAFNAVMAPMLNAEAGASMRHFVRHLAADLPLHRRMTRVARALGDPRAAARSLAGHCEVGARLAARMGLGDDVCASLAHAYERWDGKGHPGGLAGDAVPIAIRVVSAARDAELWSREGWQVAGDVLVRRRARAYDPEVVDALVDVGEPALRELDGEDARAAVLAAEPTPPAVVRDVDAALTAIAEFTDIKSPWFRGHSPGVARLARAAARAAGISEEDATVAARAALVHDVGIVGVANGVWDHPAPLAAHQWERARVHAYLGERVLRGATLLAPFADVAALHHERADGSGYHRGTKADGLPQVARLLAVADAYHAMTENRPHRAALDAPHAAEQLLDGADAGRFVRSDVDAVLAAAGQATRPPHAPRPANLTEREVDVLRLIARGLSNKEAAARLGISPKTVGHHVEHIYAKAGVTTRAGATLFAMEHDLLAR